MCLVSSCILLLPTRNKDLSQAGEACYHMMVSLGIESTRQRWQRAETDKAWKTGNPVKHLVTEILHPELLQQKKNPEQFIYKVKTASM